MDGRGAYLSMKHHYLGESFAAWLHSTADQVIGDAFFDGTRNFTFKQYSKLLNQAFTDIESTGERVDETRKVHVLLQGITNSRLSNAKTKILATPTLKDAFEHAVNFLNQFLDEKRSISRGNKQSSSTRNISATNSSRGQDHGQDTNYRGGHKSKIKSWNKKNKTAQGNHTKAKSLVTDRYYVYNDWIELSDEDKAQVQALQNERDRKQNIQAVTFAPTPIIHQYNSVSTDADYHLL
jgi:hypothetical protein